jgi:arylsulfatase A
MKNLLAKIQLSRDFLAPILIITLLGFYACQEKQSIKKVKPDARQKPNILLLLADDLGYGDLSCYGSPSVFTPNIDKLGQNGTRFTNFYAGSAVCTPSRASLLTGQFPFRFNILGHFSSDSEYLPDGIITIPHILKKAGYYTAHIGKWHLGGVSPSVADDRKNNFQPGPGEHGFDDYLVMDEGPNSERASLLTKNRMYRDGASFCRLNDQKLPESSKFLTDYQADRAIEMINQASGKLPFYVQVWFDAPHTPYEPAPGPAIDEFQSKGVTGDQLLWRSMMVNLDMNIGRIIRCLDSLNLTENTLIIFTSDNGPAFQGSPGPFRGGKTDIHEGGIRVPLIIHWPGHVAPNYISAQSSHMVDFLPTLANLAGVEPEMKNQDGMDLLPNWLEGKRLEHKPMYWQIIKYPGYQNQGPRPLPHATNAILDGYWKLLADDTTATELFDLNNDHRELYNLLETYPEKKQQLQKDLKNMISESRNIREISKSDKQVNK